MPTPKSVLTLTNPPKHSCFSLSSIHNINSKKFYIFLVNCNLINNKLNLNLSVTVIYISKFSFHSSPTLVSNMKKLFLFTFLLCFLLFTSSFIDIVNAKPGKSSYVIVLCVIVLIDNIWYIFVLFYECVWSVLWQEMQEEMLKGRSEG